MIRIKESEQILIIGKRGSGKSTLSRQIIKYNIDNFEKSIFIDTIGTQYNYGYIVNNFEDFINILLNKKKFVITYKMNTEDADSEIVFDLITKMIYENIENVFFVVDEIDFYISSFHSKPKYIDYISRYGRHKKITVLMNCRRTQDISKSMTSQLSKIICFKLTEPRDIKYIESLAGKQTAEDIKKLGLYKYKVIEL